MKRISDYSAQMEKSIREINLPGGILDTLYQPISYALASGGKRLRPSLLLMAADCFGGKATEAFSAAAGIEVFHNFTLLHDDVMDNSDTRRGRQSVYAKWGVNAAILSGDTMLTLATQLMTEVDDSLLRAVLDTFNSMAIRVYEGQRLDMDFETSDNVTLEDYIRMIMDKTGSLIGAACKIGALIGGASEKDADKMFEYGMMLGVAFQIQDDWLDVFGDSTTFGKPIGGDINNNKKSYLMLRGAAIGGPEAEALSDAMKLPAGDTKVKVVTRLYEKMNLSAICRQEISSYSAKALTALKATSLSDDDKEAFRAVVEKLTGRKK
ncbi:MAG: polyprenyl synthetase family protein [Muribaculaceae bacterium]|nr:polyprenyl synthetase family protein [Muribaculaceae bacterium]